MTRRTFLPFTVTVRISNTDTPALLAAPDREIAQAFRDAIASVTDGDCAYLSRALLDSDGAVIGHVSVDVDEDDET